MCSASRRGLVAALGEREWKGLTIIGQLLRILTTRIIFGLIRTPGNAGEAKREEYVIKGSVDWNARYYFIAARCWLRYVRTYALFDDIVLVVCVGLSTHKDASYRQLLSSVLSSLVHNTRDIVCCHFTLIAKLSNNSHIERHRNRVPFCLLLVTSLLDQN